MKRLFRWAIYAVVAVIILLLVALFFIDHIARKGVEYGATYALGVDTTLDSASIRIFTGSVGLSGLNIANPSGFKNPQFLKLKTAKVQATMGSLMSTSVQVPLFELDGLTMDLEKANGQTNYSVILANLKKLESGEKQNSQPNKQSKGFVIKDLFIRDIKVHADLAGFGGKLTQTDVTIDEIHLQNLGSDNQAAAMAQVTDIIIKAVLSAAAAKLGDAAKELSADLTKGLGGLQSLASQGVGATGEVSKQLLNVGSDLGKTIGGVGDAVNGLGNILKKP